MEAFFVRVMVAVMINPQVQQVLQKLVKFAVDQAMTDVADHIMAVENKIASLAASMLNNVDALDGKMGNLQQQLVDLPGQVIGSVSTAVEQAIQRMNPFHLG